MAGRVRQVVKQTRVRIFDGITQLPGKIVSLFEPHTEMKASKPTEFAKMVQLLEADNQIVTHYDVFDKRPSDRELFADAVATHKQILGRAPNVATADAGYCSQAQERSAHYASNGSRSRTGALAPPSGKPGKRADGSRKRNAGARDARAESAYSSGGTESIAAAVEAKRGCGGGWVGRDRRHAD
jgi:hypothetical protein